VNSIVSCFYNQCEIVMSFPPAHVSECISGVSPGYVEDGVQIGAEFDPAGDCYATSELCCDYHQHAILHSIWSHMENILPESSSARSLLPGLPQVQ
jgi:hypothetical protein